MKILHVNMDFLPSVGGVQVVVHNLALEQTLAGHEVCVLTSRKYARKMKGKLPYRVLPVFHRTSHMCRARGSLFKRLFFKATAAWIQRHGPFAICHLHGAMPEGNFIRAFQEAGARVVLTLHGDDIEEVPEIGYGARLDPAKDREITRRVKEADAVVGLTGYLADKIVSMGIERERVHVLPDGVALSRFRKKVSDSSRVRQEYGLPLDKTVIASIGRHSPVKGLGIIPEAAASLRKVSSDFVWAVIGPKSEQLESEIMRLNVQEHVRLLAPIKPVMTGEASDYLFPSQKMVELLQSVDIVAIPSLSETFSLGMVEAMAAKTAVIASDIPGMKHTLKDGETGVSFTPGTVHELAKAVQLMLDDPSMRKSLAANAFEAIQQFDWPKVAEGHLKLYRKLLVS